LARRLQGWRPLVGRWWKEGLAVVGTVRAFFYEILWMSAGWEDGEQGDLVFRVGSLSGLDCEWRHWSMSGGG